MKTISVNLNNQTIQADELEVGTLYRHISSDTYWKIWSTEATPFGNAVDLELKNSYGDINNSQVMSTFLPIIATVGTFEEITIEEWRSRER